jgi:hypothetical protein
MARKRLSMLLPILLPMLLTAALMSTFPIVGCGLARKRVDPALAAKTSLDRALSTMSLKQLDEASLVMKVAFNKSLESWQGSGDDITAGCKITGKEAESGLAALAPWLSRAYIAEADRLIKNPKSYRVPVNDDTCEHDCSCELGLKILDRAELDEQSHSKVKEFKQIRSRLEAKSELITSERAEICSESATWICTSDFLKALRP